MLIHLFFSIIIRDNKIALIIMIKKFTFFPYCSV